MSRRGAISCLLAFGCASSSADYTPQILVVPGAAARSLWILSRSPEAGDDAEARDGADALAEPEWEAGAEVPESDGGED